MKKLQYLVRINKDADSDWGASVPDLPGCVATGKTIDAALRRIQSAIELHLRGLREDGIKPPLPRHSSIAPKPTPREVDFYATVEVAASTLRQYLRGEMKDYEFRRLYEEADIELRVALEMTKAREVRKMSQRDLATAENSLRIQKTSCETIPDNKTDSGFHFEIFPETSSSKAMFVFCLKTSSQPVLNVIMLLIPGLL